MNARQWVKGTSPKHRLVVEVDNSNDKKDIEALDIEIPVLTPRVYREYKNLTDLDSGAMAFQTVLISNSARKNSERLYSRILLLAK